MRKKLWAYKKDYTVGKKCEIGVQIQEKRKDLRKQKDFLPAIFYSAMIHLSTAERETEENKHFGQQKTEEDRKTGRISSGGNAQGIS